MNVGNGCVIYNITAARDNVIIDREVKEGSDNLESKAAKELWYFVSLLN